MEVNGSGPDELLEVLLRTALNSLIGIADGSITATHEQILGINLALAFGKSNAISGEVLQHIFAQLQELRMAVVAMQGGQLLEEVEDDETFGG